MATKAKQVEVATFSVVEEEDAFLITVPKCEPFRNSDKPGSATYLAMVEPALNPDGTVPFRGHVETGLTVKGADGKEYDIRCGRISVWASPTEKSAPKARASKERIFVSF